jgi:hypothetical protein
MKLSQAREAYYAHSGSASSNSRQIAFAGIAVIWLFNSPSELRPIALPEELIFVALLLVISLALDLMQYVFASLIWGAFSRIVEYRIRRQLSEDLSYDPDVPANPLLNWPGLACFWAKLAVLITAYAFLGRFLFQKLQP